MKQEIFRGIATALATPMVGDRLDNMDTFACTWRAYQKRKS